MNVAEGPAAREMPIIHRIFRRQFAEVRALVQEVPSAEVMRGCAPSPTTSWYADSHAGDCRRVASPS